LTSIASPARGQEGVAIQFPIAEPSPHGRKAAIEEKSGRSNDFHE
jgi:hypothetical protein